MAERPRRAWRWAPGWLVVAATTALALTVLAVETGSQRGDWAGDVRPQMRVIEGVPNVENSIHALGSVWAVTSNRSDAFSREPLRASVVRIDPRTDAIDVVVEDLPVEPTFTAADGRLWIDAGDRMIALDAAGTEIASAALGPARIGGHVEHDGELWVVDTAGDRIRVVDTGNAAVVATLETGDFPSRPLTAFDRVWIPNLIDGTVDTFGLGGAGGRYVVDAGQLTDLTAVPRGGEGDAVWATDIDGVLHELPVGGTPIRSIELDFAVNRVVVHENRAFLLPTWGRSVAALDLETETVVGRIDIDSIPFRALVAHGLLWVVGDGTDELLTVIDPTTLEVRAQLPVGSGRSLTNGPHQPIEVGDEIWIPNRGDGTFHVIDVDSV